MKEPRARVDIQGTAITPPNLGYVFDSNKALHLIARPVTVA